MLEDFPYSWPHHAVVKSLTYDLKGGMMYLAHGFRDFSSWLLGMSLWYSGEVGGRGVDVCDRMELLTSR